MKRRALFKLIPGLAVAKEAAPALSNACESAGLTPEKVLRAKEILERNGVHENTLGLTWVRVTDRQFKDFLKVNAGKA